jgi:hypothetical protein
VNNFLHDRADSFRLKWGREQCTNFAAFVAIAWIPAMIIHWSVMLIYPGPKSPVIFDRPFLAIAGAMIVAPYLETQSMRLIFFALGKFMRNEMAMNLVSSLIWGAIHSATESWGLFAIWPFYVLGVCLLRIRTYSATRALWITTALHSAINGLSYVVYLFWEALAG